MPDAIEYLLWRHTLDDGECTTLYAVRHPIGATRVRVVHFADSLRLDVGGARNGTAEAIVGGSFVREPYRPLGEVWIGGRAADHEPVAAPYGERRAGVAGDGAGGRVRPRAAPPGRPPGGPPPARPPLPARRAGGVGPPSDPQGFSPPPGRV